MVNYILSFGMPGGFEWIIILFIALFVLVLPIVLLIWVIKFIKKSNKERQKMRMEIGKIGDELEKSSKQES